MRAMKEGTKVAMDNIGMHIIGDWLNPMKLLGPEGQLPRVVKLVDPSVQFSRIIRQTVGPDCLIIIRFYERAQSLAAPKSDAQAWYARNISRMLAMTDPNVAFEGYNEITDDQAQQYAEFEIERLRLMHSAGLRSVVGNWSVGTPDIPVWDIYRPVLDALGRADFIGLHEYWADAQMLNNDWFCGRWGHIPALQNIPPDQILVTECGRDGVGGRGGPWQGVIDESTYISELARYAEIAGPRLAVVFTGGNVTGWERYDVNGVWPRVTAHYSIPSKGGGGHKPKIRLSPWTNHFERWAVTRPFGFKDSIYSGGWHKGVDLVRTDGGTLGAGVFAPFDGIVDVVSWRDDRGWYLYLYDERQSIEFFICHLAQEPLLRPGQQVKAGEPIAIVGDTGRLSSAPHLHVGVCRVDPQTLSIKEWIDPLGEQVVIKE